MKEMGHVHRNFLSGLMGAEITKVFRIQNMFVYSENSTDIGVRWLLFFLPSMWGYPAVRVTGGHKPATEKWGKRQRAIGV
ncbi:MAG: hypothetical protein J0H69_24155 [Burkholderiales bacterium]|nr:hypothetical protein [Burkholderiales bacterium]